MNNQQLSKRYRDLERRISELKKHLVEEFEGGNISDLTKKQMDLARGFRVLCHAEIEAYFEDRATEMLTKAREKWNDKKRVNITIAALFANYERIETMAPLDTKINQVCVSFERERIRKNHGIKEDNLFKLFIPLGFEKDDFDSTWLATINSYGKDRGNTAHTAAKTQQPIDLQTEISTLDIIVNGIKDFDSLVKIKIKQ
ncbi:hypothetical protein YWY31_31390 [Paenibacillus illinoisensis]|uniref:HEPN domain-containing protein n=1 Tax=Paenibacillus illinoisensis TaxID=59845 RepID=UPI0034BA3275